MKASQIKLSELISYSDCVKAIDAIESDHANIVGGFNAFISGRQTHLTSTAKKKVESIERKMGGMK